MKTESKGVAKCSAFVRDSQEFRSVIGLRPETDYVLTDNLALYQQLTREAIPAHGIWSHLDDAARREVILDATHLMNHWY